MKKQVVKLNGARAIKRSGAKKSLVNGASAAQPITNNYTQLIQQLQKLSPDWKVDRVGIDAEIYRNHWELRAYSRNLWRENPYIIGYGQDLCANVFGPNGYTTRMMIKEEEDRVIHSPAEKASLRAAHARKAMVCEYIARRNGAKIKAARRMWKELKGVATIQVGSPDVFANQLIEKWWKIWQLPENCTVTGRLGYNESRCLRLKSCARDGEHFIRLVKDASYVPFGFKIQHINAEWCSYYFTGVAKSGRAVRFGIEYDDTGAAPVPTAYYFVKGAANQWQGFAPTAFMGQSEEQCIRIPADEIIHYAKFDDDADVTRPVPWTTPVMSNSRQLAKWMEAAVVAARVGACSNVFFEADLFGPDGTTAGTVDKEILKGLKMEMTAGGMHGLPPGVRAKEFNPNNPNPATGGFRNEMLREMCAGLPAAQFSTIGQNYSEINFSAGRLERLSITAQWMMLQEWDISTAERRIFSEWLKMALFTQAVKLPLGKFWKFNQVKFTGRRWEGVDALKEGAAKAQDLANNFTSLQEIHDEQGTDLETTLFNTAEANMMLEEFGIDSSTTKGPMVAAGGGSEDSGDAAASGAIQGTALNGAQIESLLSIVAGVTAGQFETEAAGAIIAAAFPLMTPAQITAITLKLSKKPQPETVPTTTPQQNAP